MGESPAAAVSSRRLQPHPDNLGWFQPLGSQLCHLLESAKPPPPFVLQLRGSSSFLFVASSQNCLTAHCLHSQFFITYSSMPYIKFPLF